MKELALVDRIAREPIANPRLTNQVPRLRRIGLDLLAELSDEHPEVLGLVHDVRTPNGLEYRPMRQHPITVLRKKREQLEFLRRQTNLVVASDGPPAAVVDRHVADLHTL